MVVSVNEPVSAHKITITELVEPGTSGDPVIVFGTACFSTVAELRKYFCRAEKFSIAASLGYNLQEPDASSFNGRLLGRMSFEYSDRMITNRVFEFPGGVLHFTQFLEANPALAKVVEYNPRGQ